MSLVATEPEVSGPNVMYALVLPSGKRWGEVACDFQVEDVEAIFAPEWPNKHFMTRARGGSKTSDLAGFALAWLYADSKPRERGYVVAANADQAALLIDAAAGFIARTPELADRIEHENERLVNLDNGAFVRVQKSSDSGAWGLIEPKLLVLDEFAQWPETRGAKRVYDAIRTTVQKDRECRMVILTSAGEPSHWSYKHYRAALDSEEDGWRVHEVPGPVPWQDERELEALRREYAATPSVYDRLVLNRWTSAETRAISEEDYEVAAQESFHYGDAPAGLRGGGRRFRHYAQGSRYIVTVDIGMSNDATVICVAHTEPIADKRGPQRVVVDHIDRWVGSKKRRVEIKDVRDRVGCLAAEYHAVVHADPWQFQDSLQQLRRRGVAAKVFEFSGPATARIAAALVQCFHNRQIFVPGSQVLKDELLSVQLRETVATIPRLDHEKGKHDDQAVAIGMACHLLLGKSGFSSARQFLDAVHQAGERRERRQRSKPREPGTCRHGNVGRCVACARGRSVGF